MKIAEVMASPLNLVLLALLVAGVMAGLGRRRTARGLAATAAAAMLMLAALPWDHWLVEPLENRIPPPAQLPGWVDGVVVLGGAIDPELTATRGQAALNASAERVTALLRLARAYPEARLVYSGGSGSVIHQDLKEAPVARVLLESLGIDSERVLFEDQSRNTRENAVFAHEMARPAAGETWLLVTSAVHMPRALGAFRAAGWPVIPYPVDYTTTGAQTWVGGVAAGARAVTMGLHEWAGLAYYRLRGWSDSWYPGL